MPLLEKGQCATLKICFQTFYHQDIHLLSHFSTPDIILTMISYSEILQIFVVVVFLVFDRVVVVLLRVVGIRPSRGDVQNLWSYGRAYLKPGMMVCAV